MEAKRKPYHPNVIQACKVFKSNLNPKQIISKVAPLFQENQRKSGILASVSLAQFILESNWGRSELAQKANNLFGMKVGSSNSSWHNSSTWDKKSVYSIKTKEWNGLKFVETSANFRKYSCIQQSISDHSAYLNNSMISAKKKRYEGLSGCKDYRKSFEIIKNGGYATDPKYVDKLCKIVEIYDLTQYDLKE